MQARNLALAVVVAVVMLGIGLAVGHSLAPVREVVKPVYETITITAVRVVEKTAPISVVDALGRVVIFEGPPARVVSLAPSITEILFALGLGGRVVGVTSFCNYPPEVPRLVEEGRLAVIGGYWNPDVEKVIALQPEVVIGSAGTRPHVALIERLEGAGIKTLYIKGAGASSAEDIFMDIATVAKVFGVEERAASLINDIKGEIRSVTDELPSAGLGRAKVLVLLGPPTWGLYSVGGDTFLGWVISTAGGDNIAARYSGWPLLDFEYVLSQDPNVIVVVGMGLSPEDVIKEVGATPLAETRAFKEGRVYVVSGEAEDVLVRPGPRVGKAVKLMAQIMYPEVFGEPELEAVYKMR